MERQITLMEEIVDNQKKILLQTKEFCDMNEASEILHLSTNTIYKLVSMGVLHSYKPFGKKAYFKKSDLMKVLFEKAEKEDE